MEPFVYLSKYRIAICKTCRFACVANEVTTHLRVRHPSIPPTERRQVVANIQALPRIIRNQAEICGLHYPPPNTEPIPHLVVPYTDGLRCRKCCYIARQVRKIQEHCRTEHNWQNPSSKGRPRNGVDNVAELPWIQGVYCQQFFPSRAGSKLFEVSRRPMDQKRIPESGFSGTSTLPLEPATLTPEHYAHVKGVLLRDQNYVRRENEPRVYSKTQGEDSFAATSLWLERTQWPAIFHKSRRDILRALTQLPNNCAPDLRIVIC
ncbi:Gag polyprotein [Fusarium oxysporum f. sp. albedinis]|nr:Gag polyprotein [Fusarium oxysporum f. sp. albedinis]